MALCRIPIEMSGVASPARSVNGGAHFGSLAFIALYLVLSGCGTGKEPVYPVRGRVLDEKDHPAAGALIIFNPLGQNGSNSPKPVGRVEEDGEFRLTTYTEEDGAPSGEYGVTILWPAPKKTPFGPEGPDPLKGAYADPKNTKIRFAVGANTDNEVPTIRLKRGS
jgi:hypothetical protein